MLYLKFERNIAGFHSIPKVRSRKDRRSAFNHFSAKNIPFENGGFHSIRFISFQKSGAGRTEGPCSTTFQPKIFRLKTVDSIPFHSIPFHFIPKVRSRKDRRSVFNHFSAKNIPFENRKYPDDISS